MTVIIDGAAVLRSIPLGYNKGRCSNAIDDSALWRNHMSNSVGLAKDSNEKELSNKWKSLTNERKLYVWKSWTKPGAENGSMGDWDDMHTVFDVRWLGGMYYRYDDVDMSTNVDTTTRTEMWLSANGLHVSMRESSWMSSSACVLM